GWSLIAPGERTRQEALGESARQAAGLLGGASLMLVVAGVIQGHVTPPLSPAPRWGGAGRVPGILAAFLRLPGPPGARTPPPNPLPYKGRGRSNRLPFPCREGVGG